MLVSLHTLVLAEHVRQMGQGLDRVLDWKLSSIRGQLCASKQNFLTCNHHSS